MNKKKIVLVSLTVVLAMALLVNSFVAAATSTAAYYSHIGNIYIQGTYTVGDAATIGAQIAAPDDGKFVQLGPGSYLILRFPGYTAAKPDGTTAADLRIDIFDAAFRADADIYGSLNGTNWIYLGEFADTANIDLDLIGPLKYVKVDQGTNYIDPAYPLLGFDLDAVVALNSGTLPYGEITKPAVGETVSGIVLFEAIYWDDDPSGVQWAVRKGTCAAATGTVFGNVDGHNDSYSWNGNLFQATANTSTWLNGDYCFVFNPTESGGEGEIRLTQFNVVSNDTTAPVITYVLDPTLPDGSADWYKSNVSLTWTVSEPETPASLVKTGCVDQLINADQVATEYSCSATSDGGSAGPVNVSIKRDATLPVVTVTGVVDGGVYTLGSVPAAGCNTTDATSGVNTPASLSLSGGPMGYITAACTGASDNAGNTNAASVTYQVIYNWNGFFRPVDNLPIWNKVKAGSAIPIKFSLGGDQGLSIFATDYPKSIVVSCEAGMVVDTIEETVTAGGSSLSYDPTIDQYNYVWKTEKSWTGCRQLIVRLIDGSEYRANFQFTR